MDEPTELKPDKPIVYLMRGLPSCGKSTRAIELAGEHGVICETDEFFYTQVGPDDSQYDYQMDLMDQAREWNFHRFCEAIDTSHSPIVVDRGNAISAESFRYAEKATVAGYQVKIAEPTSSWWAEIRELLADKPRSLPQLYDWAQRLSRMNRNTHRVPAHRIRHWIDRWQSDITAQDILNFKSHKSTVQ
jgi:hypothetical protein